MQLEVALSPPDLDFQLIERQMCARGCGNKILAAGECRTCYYYRRRTGRERPDLLIVKHGQRMLAKRHSRGLYF